MIIYTYISCYIREHDTAIILKRQWLWWRVSKKYIYIEFMAILDVSGVKETSGVFRRKLAFGG